MSRQWWWWRGNENEMPVKHMALFRVEDLSFFFVLLSIS